MRPLSRRALGRYGEQVACTYLAKLGYRILERNVHLRYAEIDVLALEGTALCFVEVRLRRSLGFGTPEDSLDARKRRRLRQAAQLRLGRGGLPRHTRVRFDVVAIELGQGEPAVRLIRDAF